MKNFNKKKCLQKVIIYDNLILGLNKGGQGKGLPPIIHSNKLKLNGVCMNKRYPGDSIPDGALRLRASVAAELKAARKESHLTQERLAEICGTQKSNISRMESGKYNPSLDFLVKLAESMNKELVIHLGTASVTVSK